MDITLVSRVGLQSLSDVERFLSAAQHLKALTLQLKQLRARRSRREQSLAVQIAAISEICSDQARESARLRELWSAAQAELRALELQPEAAGPGCASTPAGPCQGGSP